jgi:hypothetical protein
VVREDGHRLKLRVIGRHDWGLQLCAEMFAVSSGQTLSPHAGQNEFLSAVAAVRLLQADLSRRDLLAIVACIEATIPFREPDAGGRSLAEQLHERLERTSRSVGCAVDAAALEEMVADALAVANRDVAGFAEADPARFLANTWQLIEESNAPQVEAGTYSIRDYREALARMAGFLRTLHPAHIFHHPAGAADADRDDPLQAAARRNLEFSCRYLDHKLLSMALIEAFAELSGGDCPLSMLLGDLRGQEECPDRAEDFLPAPPRARDIDEEMLRVLRDGRARESRNDLTSSPLSAWIYTALGNAGSARALSAARAMFAGTLHAGDFLAQLPPDIVLPIGESCTQIAVSRREALLSWLRQAAAR